MALFSADCWPLWILVLAMIVAAIINGRTLTLPNRLVFPLAFGGWTLGLIHSLGLKPDGGTG